VGELDGQVAVVTGGSCSIGRSIARTLAAAGAAVVSLDIAAPEDDAIPTVRADLTREHDVGAAFRAVAGEHGAVDILVNNAGVFSHAGAGSVLGARRRRVGPSDARELCSTFLCCRAASESMRAVRSGRIVNLASGAAAFGMGELLHYVTSEPRSSG